MKNLFFYSLMAVLFSSAPVKIHGQASHIELGAPGLPSGWRYEGQLPFDQAQPMGKYYKVTFTGIQAQADADGVPGAYSWGGQMWNQPEPKNNNGHGNNVDGVDSSNPGNSKIGEDTDPTVDDEIKSSTVSAKSGAVQVELTFNQTNNSVVVNTNGTLSSVDLNLNDGSSLSYSGLSGATQTFALSGDNVTKAISSVNVTTTTTKGKKTTTDSFLLDAPIPIIPVEGWWDFWASVNTADLKSLTFRTSYLDEMSPILRKYFETPVVFKEQDINLAWHGTGNSADAEGHLYILGSAIKDPPVPTGKLNIERIWYEWHEGVLPKIGWTINRE